MYSAVFYHTLDVSDSIPGGASRILKAGTALGFDWASTPPLKSFLHYPSVQYSPP